VDSSRIIPAHALHAHAAIGRSAARAEGGESSLHRRAQQREKQVEWNMNKVLVTLILSFWAAVACAHPGVGIVEDSRGNVFYTDLKQVWRIAPDGKSSVAVPNVHTHELCVDSEDSLFGEHLWYEGDATKKWGHRVWRLSRDGTLIDVIPAREGFLADYSFVRDRAGNMYWADGNEHTVIKKRSSDGKIYTHAAADFRDIRWMTATADGTLFLIDRGDLKRVAPDGKVATIAERLSERTPPPRNVSSRHYQQGLWTDRNGNVYVAVTEEGVVLTIASDGKTAIAARSSRPWRPTGGMFDRDGDLWLLEYSVSPFQGGKARARRIDRDGKERVFE
jgi:hypothetical protein